MQEQLTEEEMELIDILYYPPLLAEAIFSNFDNLKIFDDKKTAHVRLGQYPLLPYSMLIDNDPKLSSKAVFNMRKNASEMYCYGARNFGKSLIGVKVNTILDMINPDYLLQGLASYDGRHTKKIMDEIAHAFRYNDFLKIYGIKSNATPQYIINLNNGVNLTGINMDIGGGEKKAGEGFIGQHIYILTMEEASRESYHCLNKRRDSIQEFGCIFKQSGMVDFTRVSPPGENFYDLSKQKFILNYPQYINPTWDLKKKQEKIDEYGGEDSLDYKIYVKGEVVQDGMTIFDMDRIREASFNYKKKLKLYEINKETFRYYDTRIVVDRSLGCDNIFICADIGDKGQTDIIILEEYNGIYKYRYNVVLYSLPHDEQAKILIYLINILNAEYIGIDATDGSGRAVLRELQNIYGESKYIIDVWFTKYIEVGTKKGKDGRIIYEDGKEVKQEEMVAQWSVERLRHLLYKGKIEIPRDDGLEKQLSSMIGKKSEFSGKTLYKCNLSNDHKYQAFQVFAIVQWGYEYGLYSPVSSDFFGGIV